MQRPVTARSAQTYTANEMTKLVAEATERFLDAAYMVRKALYLQSTIEDARKSGRKQEFRRGEERTTDLDVVQRWASEAWEAAEARASTNLKILALGMVDGHLSPGAFDALARQLPTRESVTSGSVVVNVSPPALTVAEGAIQAFSNFEQKGDLEFEYDRTLGAIKKIKRVPTK